MADPVFTVRDASKTFRLPSGDRLPLLHDITFSVDAGTSIAIQGRSGAGKSTLLRALGLFLPFDGGEHRLLGVDVRAAGDRRCSLLRARSIGFVFQDFRLLPNLSALQNVEYGCILAGLGRRAGRAAARSALVAVGLEHRLRSRPSQLSGGEQQRVAIARALVKEPALVLADEPTGSLDSDTADEVMDLLFNAVSATGSALVLVTHEAAVARRCERQFRIADGTLSPATAAAAVDR